MDWPLFALGFKCLWPSVCWSQYPQVYTLGGWGASPRSIFQVVRIGAGSGIKRRRLLWSRLSCLQLMWPNILKVAEWLSVQGLAIQVAVCEERHWHVNRCHLHRTCGMNCEMRCRRWRKCQAWNHFLKMLPDSCIWTPKLLWQRFGFEGFIFPKSWDRLRHCTLQATHRCWRAGLVRRRASILWASLMPCRSTGCVKQSWSTAEPACSPPSAGSQETWELLKIAVCAVSACRPNTFDRTWWLRWL